MADLLWLLLVVAGTFVLRVAPRWRLGHAISSDGYYHLAMARAIRENGRRLPDMHPRLALPHRYTYPFLYHWILAAVPSAWAERLERVSSAVCDAALVAWTWFVAWRALSAAGVETAPQIALWSAAATAIAPALLRVGGGPRAYQGTPRTLGQLLFAVWSGSLVLCAMESAPGWLPVAAVAVALAGITSKFANQAVVFCSILLLASGRWEPCASAAAGYAASVVFTRGRALGVLQGQIAHSVWYFRHLQHRFGYVAAPGLGRWWRELLQTGGRPRLIGAWAMCQRFWPHVLAVFLFHVPVFAMLAGGQAGRAVRAAGVEAGLLAELGAWLTAGVALMLSTSWRPLRFLGEPERYLENMVPLQTIGFCWLAVTGGLDWLLWAAAIYSMALYGIAVRQFRRENAWWHRLYDAFRGPAAAVDREEHLVYPLGGFFWPLLYFTRRCRILSTAANLDERHTSVTDWLAAFGNYPHPSVPLAELADRLGLDYAVGPRAAVQRYAELVGDGSLSDGTFEAVWEAEGVVAWRIGPVDARQRRAA
jgi:hypothetical protein